MCSNLLCDRMKPCAACKNDGLERLASALARRIAIFDEPPTVEGFKFDDFEIEASHDDDYEGGGPMYSRGDARGMQDRAFRRAASRRGKE